MKRIKDYQVSDLIALEAERYNYAVQLKADKGVLDLADKYNASMLDTTPYDPHSFAILQRGLLFSYQYTVANFDALGIRVVHNGNVVALIDCEPYVYEFDETARPGRTSTAGTTSTGRITPRPTWTQDVVRWGQGFPVSDLHLGNTATVPLGETDVRGADAIQTRLNEYYASFAEWNTVVGTPTPELTQTEQRNFDAAVAEAVIARL